MSVPVEIFHGGAAEYLDTVWAHVDGNSVLTFIDPFGVSAVCKEQMTSVLLADDREAPPRLLADINIGAISRYGGCPPWSTGPQPELSGRWSTANV